MIFGCCVFELYSNYYYSKNLLVAKLKNGKYTSVVIGVVHSTDVGTIGTAAYINKVYQRITKSF